MREISLDHPAAAVLMAEMLGRGEVVCFRAHGSSMRPFVRDGDLLSVQAVDEASLRVGDLVLYRSIGGKLTVHRVVKKHLRAGRVRLSIRGDARLRADTHIHAIVGRVNHIQRGHTAIDLPPGFRSPSVRVWIALHPLGPLGMRLLAAIKRVVSAILLRLQRAAAYRRMAGRLLRGRVRCRAAGQADSAALDRLYGFQAATRWHSDDPPPTRSTFFVAEIGSRVVGALSLDYLDADAPAWWLFGLVVRMPFRGAGIGEALTRLALNQARQHGASEVYLQVFEDNTASITLCQKMGFRVVRVRAAGDQAGRKRRLLVMRKEIESAKPL